MNKGNQNAKRGKVPYKAKSAVKKEAPSADLLILAEDGSNYMQWNEAIDNNFEATHGAVASFVASGTVRTIPVPELATIQAKYPNLTAATYTSLLASATVEHMKQERQDKTALEEMFGTIKQCLSREGLSKVKMHADWPQISTDMDPARLLQLVRSTHSMRTANVTEETARYVMLTRYMSVRMSPDESLSQYRDKFLLTVQNLTQVNHPQIPTAAQQARHFLMRLDTARYSEYQRDELNNEDRPGYVFPATIQDVMNNAARYIPTARPGQARKQPMAYAFDAEKPCHICGQLGHWSPQCPQKNAKGANPQDSSGDSSGDTKTSGTDQAAKKDKKKKEEKKKKPASIDANAASMQDTSPPLMQDIFDNYCTTINSYHYEWSKRDPRAVSIDTLANHSFGWNVELMDNVQEQAFIINGVTGKGKGTSMGWFPGFGPMAVTQNSKVNAICTSDIEERYRVSYHPLKVYRVHISEDFTIDFDYDKSSKSYTCIFTRNIQDKLRNIEADARLTREHELHANTTTVAENEAKFTAKEVKLAKDARYPMRKLYHPSDNALTRTLTQGVFLNSGVTGSDVLRATSIYGKDVAALKGKTKAGGPVAAHEVLVPAMEQKEQTAYVDIFFWREVPFMLSIVKPLRLLIVLPIVGAQTSTNLRPVLEKLVAMVEARGFKIVKIVTDPAKSLASLVGLVPINHTTVGAATHVADAEVEIRGIKERLRATEQSLPFPLARRLIRHEVMGAVAAINTVLRPGQTVSSRELYSGVKLDLRRDFRVAFGEYCEVAVDTMPRNGPSPRTASAIALCPVGNDRGTWWFYNMKTKATFRADKWTVMPTSALVIETMTSLYNQDEPKKRRLTRPDTAQDGVAAETDPPAQVDAQEVADIIAVPTMRDAPTADINAPVEDDGFNENIEDMPDQMEDQGQDASHVYDPVAMPETNSEPMDNSAGTTSTYANGYGTEDFIEKLGARLVSGVRKSYRISKRQAEQRVVDGYRMSIAKALKKDEKSSKSAIVAELSQMISKQVWTAVNKSQLSKKQLSGLIRCHMFLKEKFNAQGNFEKVKARLAAGGDLQDKNLYETLSSPTVSLESVMMVVAIAAIEKRQVRSYDITGAYFEVSLPEGDEVFMYLDPVLTKILSELDPQAATMIDEKGGLVVKLNKALYGLVQSSLLWYKRLTSALLEHGFIANEYDPCVFNKTVFGDQITVCVHVDDLLVTSTNERALDGFQKMLEANFENITARRGNQHSYLAMNIECTSDGITVDMKAYIDKLLDGRHVSRAKSPANADLFDVSDTSPKLSDAKRKIFHSDVARLLYLAKRTRVDILTAISHLSSRVTDPTEDDEAKLDRVFGYLAETRDLVLWYKSGGQVTVDAFVDASFGVHADGKGRTGVVLMLGGAVVGAWSARQKIVTKSSTESEIVAVSDGLNHILWSRWFLMSQGYVPPPTVIYEDNDAVIKIMKNGRNTSHRTKHLKIRYFFARDCAKNGDIQFLHKSTKDMIADMCTKPLSGSGFRHLVALLMGNSR